MLSVFLESLFNGEHSDSILFPKVQVGIRCFSLELGKQISVSYFVQTGKKMTVLKETPLGHRPSGGGVAAVRCALSVNVLSREVPGSAWGSLLSLLSPCLV